jgi:uncharacterized protein YegL
VIESEVFNCVQFADNPEPRCPCLLLLDTSGSMKGKPLAQLNQALKAFYEELSRDPLAAKRVEIATITFGPVRLEHDFLSIDHFGPHQLEAGHVTPMGEAICRGVELLEQRKRVYRQNGISYFRPWIFLITDGEPTDDWQLAKRFIHEGERDKKFSFFSVGVEEANMELLKELSVRRPLKLKGLKFMELFQWLSSSLSSISHSQPGQIGKVSLQVPYGDDGWAEVEV